MNWKTRLLWKRSAGMLLLSPLAAWAALFLAQLAYLLTKDSDLSDWQGLFQTGLLGLMLGGLFGFLENLSITPPRNLWKPLLWGAVPGMGLALAFHQITDGNGLPFMVGGALGGGLLGGRLQRREPLARLAQVLLIMGLWYGIPLFTEQVLQFFPQDFIGYLILLSVWTLGAALLVQGVNLLTLRRWFRLVVGGQEETIYPLWGQRIVVGYHPGCQVNLSPKGEVFPRHCVLQWENGHFEIIDDEQGGIVYVNFRPVQSHTLKHGDMVRLGTVLLQYGERGGP
ncbi:MAG: FHA domain-containing protein [Deltaproteobacteria bacterium]|nr:FHA domain-containing protein [Deltaproteobacteria bacterium]